MQHSPSWRANSSTACQEIPHILWNPKVQYCIYKRLPPVPVQSHIDPVHASHCISLRSILVLSSIFGHVFPVVSFPQASPPKLCMHLSSPYTCHMPCPSHSSFDCLNNFWWEIQHNEALHYAVPCHLLPPRPIQPPQHPQHMFLPQCEHMLFTTIK